MVDGFSSADPRLARGPQVAAKPKRRRSSGSSRKRTPSVSIIGGTVKIDGVGYSVAPSLQEEFIRKRTGGSGSSAQAAIKVAKERAASEVAKQKAAELKRIEDAKSFAEKTRIAREIVMSRQAQSEFQRILNFRANLIRKGSTEDKRMSTDIKTGDKLEVSQWSTKEGDRTERIKNLTKGTTTYSTFKKGRKTGGVSMGSIPTVSASAHIAGVKITASSNPTKLMVVLPNGVKGTINAKGRVVIGKRLGGKKYEFQDGVLRKVNDVDIYEEKLKPVEVSRRDKIISMQRAKDLSSRWKQDIETTKNSLKSAASRGDSSRLAELQRLGNNRSPSQNLQYKKLLKETAKNYELGGELVGKIIGTSLINMGVGSVELLKALKSNPKATLIALPPAIYEGVREDFNRVMSGDPLEIGSVGLEFWTFGKVGKIAGKVGKTGLRTSYGIGSTLSPKYLGAISNKLFISPVTLRGIAVKTAAGRAVEKAIANSLKQSGITGKVTAFNKKLKAKKNLVDRKLNRIKVRASRVKKRVKVGVAVAKDITANLESRININKQFTRAKKNFKKSINKGRTLRLTSPNYKQALNNINTLSDTISQVKTYEFLIKLTKRGGSITKKQSKELLSAVKKQYRANLEATAEYQALRRLSRQDRFLSVKLIKQGKIKSAKVLLNKLVKGIKSIQAVKFIGKNLSSIKRGVKVRIKKVKAPVVKVKKRVGRKVKITKERVRVKKRRLVKKVKRPFLVAAEKRRIKKTIRYRMEKARPLREVSLDQLQRTPSVTAMNKFIDRFFKELELRQKITVAPKTYSQMKNILKKRMRKAIKTGNKEEIKNFGIAIRKLVIDMNKPVSKPTIRAKMKPFKEAGKPAPKKFQMKTIPEFEPKTPKGSYVEVKSGQMVLLQKVKTKQIQKAKVVSVKKKAISLKPIVQYGVKSLSVVALKNMGKQAFSKVSNHGQLVKVLQDSAQDLKVLQTVGQASGVNVASAVTSAVNSIVRSKTRLKTKQVLKTKKKPIVRVRFKKEKNTRKLRKKVMGYAFVVKKAGKNIKLKMPPMTLRDAWDVGSYKLDNTLQRTGKLIPVGMVNVVAKLPKSIAGYYRKKSKKFRRVKIKKGKVLSLEKKIIEKKKYIGDTLSERLELQKARKRSALKKRGTTKRKTTKRVKSRKKLPTLNSLKTKKEKLILKRKRMINKLKNS